MKKIIVGVALAVLAAQSAWAHPESAHQAPHAPKPDAGAPQADVALMSHNSGRRPSA